MHDVIDTRQVCKASHYISHDITRFHFIQKVSLPSHIELGILTQTALFDETTEVTHVAELKEEIHIVCSLKSPMVCYYVCVRLWN